jgi:hypothetical protein
MRLKLNQTLNLRNGDTEHGIPLFCDYKMYKFSAGLYKLKIK